ncbi:MAG: GH3 auxin-responsive promoter family protein, partial [Dehalococcoidia bacterium]|nr:GH3 auxin-responsive promoter family protein [Dehalococcoidia bacterium]
VVRLYIELREEIGVTELEKLIHEQLASLNRDYSDLESMLGIQPLRVTLVPAGTFQRYYEERKRDGVALAHMKPPHMNASDAIIEDLLGQAQSN